MSGTDTSTTQPNGIWTYTAGTDGGAQSRYEVKGVHRRPVGAVGFDPATWTLEWTSVQVLGTDTSAILGPLDDGVTYRMYVRPHQMRQAGTPAPGEATSVGSRIVLVVRQPRHELVD